MPTPSLQEAQTSFNQQFYRWRHTISPISMNSSRGKVALFPPVPQEFTPDAVTPLQLFDTFQTALTAMHMDLHPEALANILAFVKTEIYQGGGEPRLAVALDEFSLTKLKIISTYFIQTFYLVVALNSLYENPEFIGEERKIVVRNLTELIGRRLSQIKVITQV